MRKPAAERRAEIIQAAAAEFARTGLVGTGLEAIAARAGVSHPRVVQMFGSKRALFLAVLEDVFDRVEDAFVKAAPAGAGADGSSALVDLGDAYRRLLQRDDTIGPVMLHGYAAASDEVVREHVTRRYLRMQRLVVRLAEADAMQVRAFFATGLVITVSAVLQLPGRRADAAWGKWLLELVSRVS